MRFIRLVAPLAALLVLFLAGPAHAGTTAAPNACRYSYDNYFRDTGVRLSGTASIVPTAAHPAPTEVVPGQQVKLGGATVHFDFPDILARFGYAAGLLNPGDNTITAKVWVAVKASNTKEHTQVVGPLTVTATTTIVTDPTDDDRFISATPFAYTDPVLPDTTWTATGGDVALNQAGGGTLPLLPIGPSGAARQPIGSAVIQTTLNSLNFVMDCAPGAATDVNVSDGAGPGYAAAPAAPFDTVAGPQNATCLDDPGRQVSGPAADLPAGITREIDPVTLGLTAPTAASTFAAGVPYTLSSARLRVVLGADTVATLGRFADGATALITPDQAYPLHVWVTIAATNTIEAAQTVAATATYTLHPAVTPVTSSSAWAPSEILVDLPSTTWTPTGGGPIAFSSAQPAAMTPIDVTGPAVGGPGGGPVSSTFSASPYGNVVLRGDTERNPISFDCVPGAISIASAAVPWSNRGRIAAPDGSAGRYAIDVASVLAPFATVSAVPEAGGGAGAGGGDGATPIVGTGPAPTQPGTTAPSHVAPPVASPGRVASTRLKADRRGRVKLLVSCAGPATTCRGTVRIRSIARVKLGKRRLLLTVVVARAYAAKSGRPTTLTLALGTTARTVLRHNKRLRVLVTLKPAHGAVSTRTLLLS